VADADAHTLHRLQLSGPWAADARVVLTGDALPMTLVPHLPEGAVQAADAWILTASTGDLVLDLPACS
jgi:hypothetical protein